MALLEQRRRQRSSIAPLPSRTNLFADAWTKLQGLTDQPFEEQPDLFSDAWLKLLRQASAPLPQPAPSGQLPPGTDWNAIRTYTDAVAKREADRRANEQKALQQLAKLKRSEQLLVDAERKRKEIASKAFLRRGLAPATRAVARARFGAADLTRRKQEEEKDDSLLSKAMRVVGGTPGLNLIPQALQVADTGRRGVIAGSVELGDAARQAAGKDVGTDFGGKIRQTGFSWEDFKRNTLDSEKANFGFGDVYQEGIETAGVEDTPLGNIWTRRVVGLAGDVATDPLTYIPLGVAASGLSRPTARVGRSAMRRNASLVPEGVRRAQARIARDRFLTQTRRGRALESTVRRTVAAPTDAGTLVKRLPGLAPTTAREIAAAPTREAAQELASRALRMGDYIPDISIRRQALMATTGRGLKAAGGLGLGRRVVRESEGLFDVGGKARRLARSSKGPVAATATTATATARRAPVKASLARAGIRSGDAREIVAQSSMGMNAWDRVNRLLVDADAAPGIVADIVEATLEKVLPKNKTAVNFNRAMADLDADPDVMQALLEAETLIATARGDFGEEATGQLLTELGVGYTRPGNANLDQLLRRAGNRAGLAVPTPNIRKVSDGAINKLRKRIEKEVSDDLLKGELRASLSKVKPGKAGVRQLNAVAKSITLAADDDVAQDALSMFARYGETLKDKADLVGGGRVGLGQKVNPVRQLGVLVTSLTETIPHHQLRFLSTANAELAIQERVKAFDSYLGAIGMEYNARSWLRQAVADVQAEADLYKVVEDALTVMANAEGVPPEVLAALLRETQAEARKMGFKATSSGDLLDEVQNLSQLNETVALPNPADVKRTLRELAEGMDDPNKAQEVYRYLRDAAASGVSYVSPKFAWLHRTWKLMVVTNLYMPVVGGFVGFAGTEGDLQDRLKGGFQWAAMGALAPSRYIIRVAGIEESARRLLVRGFVPTEFIPGLAKRSATHGLDRPLVSAHLLKSGDPTGSWVRSELMDRTTGEFSALAAPNRSGVMVKLGRKQPRYLDGWHRIVNHEINDANGALDRILLSHRAGYMTRKQVDDWFDIFLKSDDGKLWWRRWKGAYGAPPSPKEAFERQLKFVEDYVPADIARTRLPAFDADFQEVPRSLLKGHVKRNTSPAFIHAENTWTIPRGKTFFSDLGTIQHQITDKFIFGGPTRTMHRHPMARAVYKDEYMTLVRAGVEPKRAQEMADLKAINTTNEVMFNQNNESRFAQKVDIIFPFQQPREELVRVWAPLMFNNKIRTIQLTSLGARALEAGVSNGTFYEYTNPYTGEKEWRAKIPGSARLSRALGGVNADFDFGLRDLLFLTQDNMGSTLGIPSPGGPFFTVVTRSYIDAFPEQYGNLPDPVKEYLFPFGQSGRLGRNEPNRLWMAFMGTPAPWEFANEWEQKEEYRRAQINMFLHLRYDHFKKTGEWKDPTQAEVEAATKAFFQTQALMGAVWPAPNRYIQPWQELVEKAQKPFINVRGELDYYAFINEHPNMAPFVTGRGEFVGPDTFKNWTRSDEERAEDYVKHWQQTMSLKDFRAELKENRLTAEAWQERNLIPFKYPDWELADAYIAWETKWLEKHPQVVEATRNNYFRDQHLHRILNMSEGPARDRALDEWRRKYNVSAQSYKHHVERLKREGWEVDYWKYSRPSEVVVEDVAKEVRRLGNDWSIEQNIVAQLNPAEQVKYWKQKQSELVYYDDKDPQDILDDYWRFSDYVGDVYRRHPKLSSGGNQSRIEEQIEEWRGDTRKQINAIYEEINLVSARFNELKEAGEEWSAEGQALYAKRTALYDMVEALKNKQFQELPAKLEWYDDMMAVTALMRDGKPTRQSKMALQAMLSRPLGYGGFIPSNEELSVLNMPKEVREAYTQDIINQLNLPSVKGTKGKLYWEWLTDFQKDWLEKNLPSDMIDDWKKDLAENALPRGSGGTGSEADNVELQWAYEMFRQYNRRPEGAEPPAAYEQYLNLPRDKAVRKAFIEAHPEVGEWLNLGPMANMPDHIKQAVRNIMVKFGKWEGEIDNSVGGGGGAASNPELAWAYEMFKQYSKRAEGAKAPAAYEEYLKLPANPAVRNQFLERHPEVGKWISMGPMANMPAHVRFMVQNIMIKYGKWEGEITPDAEINDLAFAREQLKRWNLRGNKPRPQAYDTWLQMPSGVEKAQFLKDHPEIQEWLKLGPMSNMPDAYQDVVRDIMVRYGEWTQETDGLGKVISDYYATPGYAREQYLEKHPELVAYWNAIRTPEEKRMSAMVDQYFSIQDPNSKHAFLIIHPELKDYFVQRRTERYEKFLTHVAIYMGGHPEMFERYLERQEDILNDLLLRYATPPLLREVSPIRDARVTDRQRIRG